MKSGPAARQHPPKWPRSEGNAMSLNEEVEMLRRIQLFAKVEPAKLKLLAFTSERAVFQAEEVLFHQGDAADAAYIIVAGEVAVGGGSPSRGRPQGCRAG